MASINIPDGSKWYDLAPSIEDDGSEKGRLGKIALDKFTLQVKSAFDADIVAYRKKRNINKNSDKKWIDDVVKKGTLSDKVAALTLQVQESPIHHLEELDLLIAMAVKQEQRTSQLALEALKDLLIHNLLPDRKLKLFMNRPLGHPKMNVQYGIIYWFEDNLIRRIEKITFALEEGLKSNLDYFKKFCMAIIADIVTHKPEQDGRLLTVLVNKLGDPKGPIYSKCVDLLLDIVSKQPKLKLRVVKEVLELMYRSSVTSRSSQNCVLFLSRLKLSKKTDSNTAEKLLEGYIVLFEKITASKESKSKLLTSIFTGIATALKFVKDYHSIAKHMDTIFKIVHTSSFSTSIRALLLLSQILTLIKKNDFHMNPLLSSKSLNLKDYKKGDDKTSKVMAGGDDGLNGRSDSYVQDLTNRYYRAVYSKLLADEVCHVCRGMIRDLQPYMCTYLAIH